MTISETACVFDAPNRLPVGVIRLKLVNKIQTLARFILMRLDAGHTLKDLEDLDKNGIPGRPDWITESALIDVPRAEIGVMEATVTPGSYAFHCGYPNGSGGVTSFLKGPLEGATQP